MFKWIVKNPKATNAIFLDKKNNQEGRPFKSRFLQAGLVKYDFGVCLLKKETIDKFINTFVGCPVIINHQDNIDQSDIIGTIKNIWFSPEDGWFWCDGIITDEKAIELIEKGYNISCQYRITDYIDNTENKLHNANQYDKEILNGVFEHLAIVENPRYEDAFIAMNAYIALNDDEFEQKHSRDDEGKFTSGGNSGVNPNYKEELEDFIEKAKKDPNARQKISVGAVSDKLQKDAEEYGIDFKNYTHDLDVSGTRHTYKNHGDEKKEAKRGQIAIIDEDFEKIPDIVNNYDGIEFGEEDKKGTPLIKYRKNFGNGTTYYVEEIRTKHNKLTIKTMYKTKKASNSGFFASNVLQRSEYASNIIIAHNSSNLNPTMKKYNKVFDYIKNYKGGPMDKETKGIFNSLIEALKARNEAEEEKEKEKDNKAQNEDVDKRKLIDEVGGILKGKVDEEIWRTIIKKMEEASYNKSSTGTADNEDDDYKNKAENKKAKNEDVDKRDIIRQIMAIAGKHEDDEDVRTIAKLAEKLAYDKSEAGTADNKAKNKCKNEDDEENKEKEYEELKEKVEEEAENKKAKNSLDDAINCLYDVLTPKAEDVYVSAAKGLELGKQIYG